ncbi:L-glyceraldehyde 3-phosphate reductase [compost metagenome]
MLATKVYFPMSNLESGLSRAKIMQSIDDSLQRLGTDYVDLLQIHRWDYETPLEETLEALHEVMKAGKARYIGASSMYAWQFAKALYTADLHGWTRFVSMQDQYNLIQREEEREMLPLCAAEGIAVLPWSPLARGRLTRPWGETTARLVSDQVGKNLYDETEGIDAIIAERVASIAQERGVSRAQIALAWLLSKPVVSAPIIGASRHEHLEDAVAAVDLELTQEEIAELETAYVPHHVTGFE